MFRTRLGKGLRVKPVSQKVLQEYFEALADEPVPTSAQRSRELLTSYAELRYRISGGDRCVVCHAHVRHVVPVTVQREDGTLKQFTCLCHRCLQAEKATARSVEMRIGRARWVVKKGK